jgi:outer membrane lipoprotein carrier protein
VAVIVVAGRAATPVLAVTEAKAAPAVHALEAHYHNVKTLRAIFLQRYSDGREGPQVQSGTVYFSRPGRMRWEYESPAQQLFISDGKTVWFFVPADRTVTRAPMKESADWRTPLALLTGKAKLSELCSRIDLTNATPGTAGDVVLRCLPRGEKSASKLAAKQDDPDTILTTPGQPFDQVLLEVNPSTGELADVRVIEPGGIEIDYRFGNWIENPPLTDSLFHFEPPPGVAIVDESKDLRAAP